jgi:hypothetical protein
MSPLDRCYASEQENGPSRTHGNYDKTAIKEPQACGGFGRAVVVAANEEFCTLRP